MGKSNSVWLTSYIYLVYLPQVIKLNSLHNTSLFFSGLSAVTALLSHASSAHYKILSISIPGKTHADECYSQSFNDQDKTSMRLVLKHFDYDLLTLES